MECSQMYFDWGLFNQTTIHGHPYLSDQNLIMECTYSKKVLHVEGPSRDWCKLVVRLTNLEPSWSSSSGSSRPTLPSPQGGTKRGRALNGKHLRSAMFHAHPPIADNGKLITQASNNKISMSKLSNKSKASAGQGQEVERPCPLENWSGPIKARARSQIHCHEGFQRALSILES